MRRDSRLGKRSAGLATRLATSNPCSCRMPGSCWLRLRRRVCTAAEQGVHFLSGAKTQNQQQPASSHLAVRVQCLNQLLRVWRHALRQRLRHHCGVRPSARPPKAHAGRGARLFVVPRHIERPLAGVHVGIRHGRVRRGQVAQRAALRLAEGHVAAVLLAAARRAGAPRHAPVAVQIHLRQRLAAAQLPFLHRTASVRDLRVPRQSRAASNALRRAAQRVLPTHLDRHQRDGNALQQLSRPSVERQSSPLRRQHALGCCGRRRSLSLRPRFQLGTLPCVAVRGAKADQHMRVRRKRRSPERGRQDARLRAPGPATARCRW